MHITTLPYQFIHTNDQLNGIDCFNTGMIDKETILDNETVCLMFKFVKAMAKKAKTTAIKVYSQVLASNG